MSFALHRLTNTVYTITTAKHCSLTVAGSLHGFAASSIAFISHERKRVVIQFLSIHNIDVFYRRSYWSIHNIDVLLLSFILKYSQYWRFLLSFILKYSQYWRSLLSFILKYSQYWRFLLSFILKYSQYWRFYRRSYWSIHNIDVLLLSFILKYSQYWRFFQEYVLSNSNFQYCSDRFMNSFRSLWVHRWYNRWTSVNICQSWNVVRFLCHI